MRCNDVLNQSPPAAGGLCPLTSTELVLGSHLVSLNPSVLDTIHANTWHRLIVRVAWLDYWVSCAAYIRFTIFCDHTAVGCWSRVALCTHSGASQK